MNMNVRSCKPICSRFTLLGLAVLALVLLAGTYQPLSAQSGPSGTTAAAQPAASAGPGAGEEKGAAAAAPQSSPAAGEGVKLGGYDVHSEFEIGYRWSSKIDGNDQMFRSQVNLFQGTRLLNTYLSMRGEPGIGLFDRLDLSLNNWGDPYGTMRFNMSLVDAYQLNVSYRDLNYYNYISTLANPLLGTGNTFPQHNLDVNYRMADVELRLFPNHTIVPYAGYSRNSAAGPGYTTVSSTGNQFLLRSDWGYTSNELHAGVQINFSNLNLNLEQGYRSIRNVTQLEDAGEPQGNQGSRPYFGQPVRLDSLSAGYSGKTKLPTTRILAKFRPYENLRMTGRYIYTMGDTNSHLAENRTGNLVSLEDFVRYGAAADSLNGRAKKPNHNGSFLVEFSPVSRLTFTDHVETLNYHISGEGIYSLLYLNASSLLGSGTPTESYSITGQLNTEFEYSEVRNQAEMEYELFPGLAVRAGHRYTSVDVSVNDSEDAQSSYFSAKAVSVGVAYRPSRNLRLGMDYTNNQTNQPLTRTDLLNYDQFNFDWNVGSWMGFTVNGKVAVQRNSNKVTDIGFRSWNKNYVAGLNWESGERLYVGLDYSRTDLHSILSIIIPQNFRSESSQFDEQISGIGGRMGVGIYRGTKLEMGYRGIINRGTVPIDYHQPYASLWLPLGHNLAFKPSWQFLQYSEKLSDLEDYKTHLMTFSLVYSR